MMTLLTETHLERAIAAGQHLDAAAKPLRVLSSVGWDDTLREKFLQDGLLPTPQYPSVDMSSSLEAIASARKALEGDHPVFAWLRRIADALENTVHMMAARGTPEFTGHSIALYGCPTCTLLDGSTRVIDMARHLDAVLEDVETAELMLDGAEESLSAQDFAQRLTTRLGPHFGDMAPKVELWDTLSAKALAGPRRIRVRASARFTARDVDQLLQHEALIHVATSLNGRAQDSFPILGRAHAGTTEVQEGLAVFAEIISGAIDPNRFRRLADRVIAIQMALDGADFKEVFDFYHARTDDPDQSYENTRRVFRGGVVSGGAPFTKDMVYLNGLLRVHNFLRTVVSLKRADLIPLLFVGKLDIEDIPALPSLMQSDHLSRPRFMPDWIKDQRFLVSYLAYSSFLNQVKLPGFQAYYKEALAGVERVSQK